MKLTKSKLKQIIKEELSHIYNEDILDVFKKKEETREERLTRITKEDFMKELGGKDIYDGMPPEAKEKAEKHM